MATGSPKTATASAKLSRRQRRSQSTASPPTPDPPPTPYIIRPPQPFFRGDAVFSGGVLSQVSARLRLIDVTTQPASPDPTSGDPRSLHVWTLEVKNVGAVAYELFPATQMYISRIATGAGDVDGVWGASLAAAHEAGLTATYDALALAPGMTRTFQLAAHTPAGTATRFTYLLDPTTRDIATHIPGSNPLTWTTATNPHCSGDINDPGAGGVLPP